MLYSYKSKTIGKHDQIKCYNSQEFCSGYIPDYKLTKKVLNKLTTYTQLHLKHLRHDDIVNTYLSEHSPWHRDHSRRKVWRISGWELVCHIDTTAHCCSWSHQDQRLETEKFKTLHNNRWSYYTILMFILHLFFLHLEANYAHFKDAKSSLLSGYLYQQCSRALCQFRSNSWTALQQSHQLRATACKGLAQGP